MIANIKHAVRNRETVSIGGGDFNPKELKEFVAKYESLVDALYGALPFVEDSENDPAFKPGVVAARVKAIKSLLETLEN